MAGGWEDWRRWKLQGVAMAEEAERQVHGPKRQREREKAASIRRGQEKRLAQLRARTAMESSRAAEKQELVRSISVKLQRRVCGRPFPKVLAAFGVESSGSSEAAMAKAYKKALVKYHPDRAAQRGCEYEEQLEMEETYKLLQNLHSEWTESLRAGVEPEEEEDEPPFTPPARRGGGRREGAAGGQGQGPGQGQGEVPRSWAEAGAGGGPAARAAAAANVAARAARAAAAAATAARRQAEHEHAQGTMPRANAWGPGGRQTAAAAARSGGGGGRGPGAGGMPTPLRQRSAYF